MDEDLKGLFQPNQVYDSNNGLSAFKLTDMHQLVLSFYSVLAVSNESCSYLCAGRDLVNHKLDFKTCENLK